MFLNTHHAFTTSHRYTQLYGSCPGPKGFFYYTTLHSSGDIKRRGKKPCSKKRGKIGIAFCLYWFVLTVFLHGENMVSCMSLWESKTNGNGEPLRFSLSSTKYVMKNLKQSFRFDRT